MSTNKLQNIIELIQFGELSKRDIDVLYAFVSDVKKRYVDKPEGGPKNLVLNKFVNELDQFIDGYYDTDYEIIDDWRDEIVGNMQLKKRSRKDIDAVREELQIICDEALKLLDETMNGASRDYAVRVEKLIKKFERLWKKWKLGKNDYDY